MRPRWRTTIGVLGIIFGCFGIMSASQMALTPTMVELQREFITALQTHASQEGPGESFAKPFAEVFQGFLAPTPEWFTPWCIGLGLISLLISGLYVFGAIWLLLLKASGPRLFCTALVASVIAAVAQSIGLVLAGETWGVATAFSPSFGVVIDVVLLLVLLAHRKEWSRGIDAKPPIVHGATG